MFDLAPYAMREQDSRGRRYPEPAHPYRSEYQRDRDRVIHSRAFRRLEKKTQVFDPDVSDHFRNRLTHTIEVAQIARTVAAALRLNVDLSEALALSHDVGHGPFSHTGEGILDSLMRRYGSSFDHNIHGLRIVERFEEKYPSFPGLNLTFELREGIVKHSRDYLPGHPQFADLSEYLLGQRPPLEAQLIDLADEIAYNTGDLDDGYESKLLPVEMLVEELPLFRKYFAEAENRYATSPEKLKFNMAVRAMLDSLVTDLIETSARAVAESGAGCVQDIRDAPKRLMHFGVLADSNREIKGFLARRLYSHEKITSSRRHAENIIRTLFEYYMADPARLPRNHFVKLAEQSLPAHRVVCDYLAGMTDDYIRRRFEEFCSA